MKNASAIILSIVLMAGHAIAQDYSHGRFSTEGRFYSGDPRPPAEVALIVGDYWDILTGDYCPSFDALTEEGKPSKPLFVGKSKLEVLPGHYSITLGCVTESAHLQAWNRTTAFKPIVVEIDAKAGHVYCIMIDRKKGMVPVVTEIASDEDYDRIKDTGGNPQGLRKTVKSYFQGKRHEVQEAHMTKNPNEVARWN